MPRPKCKKTERRWREIVERQADSGLSVREFCEMEGVSSASLYNWRRRLSEIRSGRGRRSPSDPVADRSSDKSLFVPLALLEPKSSLEILHPRGCRIRLTGDVDGAALRRVLEALDQGAAE